MISEIEQQTSDIDWFFTDGVDIAFVASGGGKLPDSIAESINYGLLSSFFRNLPTISETIINKNLNKILETDVDERYLFDYNMMSEKGLYSFDKTIPNNFLEPNYHLVTQPKSPLKINDLPVQIIEILRKSKCEKKIKEMLGFNLLEIS